jgi:hypothetical protein
MANVISATALSALAADEARELFGWPVSLLDQMLHIEGLAADGAIWIDEWRRLDAELRAAGPKRFPRRQAEAAREAALEAWLDSLAGEEAADIRMRRLASRLGAALHGPPDATELRDRLARIEKHLAEERDGSLRAESQKHRDLVARWLDTPVTGEGAGGRPSRPPRAPRARPAARGPGPLPG